MRPRLLSLALLFVTQITASALIDLGTSAGQTPYDPYIRPVKETLSTIDGPTATMDRVKALMSKGRGFRYAHTEPYVPASPEVTEARKVGDCKDKALWLVDELGDKNVRFVIGKMNRSEHVRHAWVMWNDGNEWWVLDCTLNFRPIRADKVSAGDYVPLYSWGKSGAYRHSPTSNLVATAGKTKEPVAAKGKRRS